MTPEQLQRAHVKALAAGDLETAAELRKQFGKYGDKGAFDYLRAVVAILIGGRFGAGAGIDAERIDHVELGRFMAELRHDTRSAEPPLNHLAVEGAIRSLYGEEYLLDQIGLRESRHGFYVVLRHMVRLQPQIQDNLDEVITEAQKIMRYWLLGP
ncbi:hypothetical protein L0U85_02040 [Glycomyces sp. L485]|uniref:hypothetical protein n=1 Tax=Glycomyces sp. L485 TaxID=2909235 RepID=UPI001F4AC246|nr:hypothetical protein [Glycomyces sp. L485]MCH7229647.1 hypothetical protein [Glycomyces sp. L485]